MRGVGGLVEAHRRLRSRLYGLLGLPFPVLEYVWRHDGGGGSAEAAPAATGGGGGCGAVCEDFAEPQPMLDLAGRAVTYGAQCPRESRVALSFARRKRERQ